jgi:hypothetical protein
MEGQTNLHLTSRSRTHGCPPVPYTEAADVCHAEEQVQGGEGQSPAAV